MFFRKQLASVFDWMPQEQKKVSKFNAMQRIGRSENKYVIIFPKISRSLLSFRPAIAEEQLDQEFSRQFAFCSAILLFYSVILNFKR